MTKVQLRIVTILRKHQIDRNGFVPNDFEKAYTGWWETRLDDFANQVAIAGDWLCMVYPDQKIRSRNKRYGSYRLKHSVEKWTSGIRTRQRVSNSALLVAAILLDIPVKRQRAGSPNGDVLIQRETRWP
jgi:hypothetical protein